MSFIHIYLNNDITIKLTDNPIYPKIYNFPNTEVGVYLQQAENLLNKNIIITAQPNNNDELMQLFSLLNTVSLQTPKTLYLVLPYHNYNRGDKTDEKTSSVNMKFISNFFETFNITKIFTCNIHSIQTLCFYKNPPINIDLFPLFEDYINTYKNINNKEKVILISPDFGRLSTIRKMSKNLQLDYICINKHRNKNNDIDELDIYATSIDYTDYTAFIVDDMGDTLETVLSIIKTLHKIKQFYICVVHGIFSNNSITKVNDKNSITKVITTNTLSQSNNRKLSDKLEVLDITNLLKTKI